MTGNELRERRALMGLTQETLGRELGVSRPTVVSWEKKGDDKVPRIVELAVDAIIRLPDVRVWFANNATVGKANT